MIFNIKKIPVLDIMKEINDYRFVKQLYVTKKLT